MRNSNYFIKLITILVFLLSLSAQAKDYGNVTVSEITGIYDADTFRVNIEGYPAIAGQNVSIRVKGVDAPEIRGACESEKVLAREAREYTARVLRSAEHVELRNIERGKYFRILADVYADGESLADGLIESGNARAYDGGKRLGWCANKK